jgi:hypothetical protein
VTTSRKKTPEVTAPGFSFCVPLGYAFFLATAIIAYAVVKIKYATFYKKVIRKHEKNTWISFQKMGDFLKRNPVFMRV